MNLTIEKQSFRFTKPFIITGHVFETVDTVKVLLSDNKAIGVGESVGAYYLNETADSMAGEIANIAADIKQLETIDELQQLMPANGARNAVDCAYWDYWCKTKGLSIWQLLNITPKPLKTVFTLGIAEPEEMGQLAQQAQSYAHLKIKLDNQQPIEKLEAIRATRPDATLIIDVNQGWTFKELQEYAPYCQRLGIAMIEQPLPRCEDEALDGYHSPVPLGADESCLHLGDFANVVNRYQVLNIKLDKCGGLSEGLKLVRAAQQNNMQLMVGNMAGSSLSMAPSFVIGQYCQFIDIDGPLLLTEDVPHGLDYQPDGMVPLPKSRLWG